MERSLWCLPLLLAVTAHANSPAATAVSPPGGKAPNAAPTPAK